MAQVKKTLDADLTPAEREVFFEMVNTGDSILVIAKRLRRAFNTVRNQVAKVLVKTKCESRVELMFNFYKARERELRKRTRA
jgi:DNA-binding NarL/FixJ family response regulator